MKDHVSGEEINYQYDELNRLSRADEASKAWGNRYEYDGFGNLLKKVVTDGYAPTLNQNVDPATNRIAGPHYDANGNFGVGSYDVLNRLMTHSGSGDEYAYTASNQRIWKKSSLKK